MTKFLILIVALVLRGILIALLLLWGIVRSISKWELRKYLKEIAISIDAHGNVVGKYALNDLFQREGYSFGDRFDTISYAIGSNQRGNKLTRLGKLLNCLLDNIDKNHSEKAVVAGDNKILKRIMNMN